VCVCAVIEIDVYILITMLGRYVIFLSSKHLRYCIIIAVMSKTARYMYRKCV